MNKNNKCDMPECVGASKDKISIVKDPSGEVLTMCESCLDGGWRSVVDVID